MINLAVIGDPISHSLSPIIHSTILKSIGVEFIYNAYRIKKGELEKFIDKVRKENIYGFNITMPHKVDIIPFLDELDGEAEKYNAVNTVKYKDGKLCGYNTDGNGFEKSLKDINIDVEGKSVLVLGAGGVANIVIPKLAEESPRSIIILNRDVEKAEQICENIKKENIEIIYDNFELDTIEKYSENVDILVNSTPLGMEGVTQNFDNLGFLNRLNKTGIVYDLVYNPRETILLKTARKVGLKTINGLDMLINQAILADEIFTGKEINNEELNQIIKSNI